MKATAILILLFWQTIAQAVPTVEVQCYNGGCLKEGWSVRDLRSGLRTFVDCIDHDCNENGWTESTPGQIGQQTRCFAGGCFKVGWETRELGTGRYSGQTSCLGRGNEGDQCLIEGWVATPNFGPQVTARCVRNDCRQLGWEVWLPNGGWARALCRAGGCFERGWIIEQ